MRVCVLTLCGVMVSSYIRRGESHWWMKGSTLPQIAEIIIKLVKDMAAVSHRRLLCASVPTLSVQTTHNRRYSLEL